MDRIYRLQEGGRYAVERGGKMYFMKGDLFGAYDIGEEVPGGFAKKLMPPVDPSIVVCIGLNYKDHAAEMKKKLPEEPLVFLKPRSSVVGSEDEIRIPKWTDPIHYESEMAVVIGKKASHVSEADAMKYVLGLTCLNDVTARELQAKDVQYSRAKGFDTFCPLGPCIAVGLDPSALDIEGKLNGEVKQKSNTRELIFTVPYLVAHVTRFMTLHPGDIITTGTPSGVGPLKPGDRITITLQGVGSLSNPCVAG